MIDHDLKREDDKSNVVMHTLQMKRAGSERGEGLPKLMYRALAAMGKQSRTSKLLEFLGSFVLGSVSELKDSELS